MIKYEIRLQFQTRQFEIVLEQVYCTETRPYNQGARLTAYELVHDKIPSTLICDDMVASLMKSKNISACVVGADRVVANGDTANKIGTYQVKLYFVNIIDIFCLVFVINYVILHSNLNDFEDS